jgi:ATP synthase protein I
VCPTESEGGPATPEDGPVDPGGPASVPGSEGPVSPERRSEGERAGWLRAHLEGAVSEKAARKLRARREGDRGIWFGLGMMGLVGWSVTVPTVLGIAVGVWLDHRGTDAGDVSWTLTGLVVGVVLGCLNAWFWIQRELEERS